MPNPNLNIDTYGFEFGSGGGGTPEGITYVVDSSQKLNNWLHGVVGNDYTHVYIAPGRHVLDYTQASTVKYLDDVSIGTKTITGAPGSVICDDTNTHSEDETHKFTHGVFGYQTRPTKDCFIKGLTIEISKYCGDISPSSETGRSYIFFNCINITECNITAVGTYDKGETGDTMGNGAPLSIAAQCINISKCSFSTGYTSADGDEQGAIFAIHSCDNIDSCFFNIINESTHERGDDDTCFTFIGSCNNISNCVADISNMSYALGASPSMFYACYNLTNIFVKSDDIDYAGIDGCGQVTNCIAKYFEDCYAMSHCCSYSISQSGYMSLAEGKHYRCYADHAKTVSVADTAAGGWNWMVSRW